MTEAVMVDLGALGTMGALALRVAYGTVRAMLRPTEGPE